MKQRILIYMPFANWVPHLATDLDIAAKHIDEGDEVFIIQCSGELPTCEPNPTHKKSICKQCMSKCKKGLGILDIPKTNIKPMILYKHTIGNLEFSDIEDLKRYEYCGVDVGMATTSSLVSMVREPQPDIDLYKKYIDTSIRMSVSIYNMIERYLQNINPNTFYLFNGRFAPLRPALRAAQHAGVKTFTHERNANNVNEYWLCEDTYLHNIEYQKQQMIQAWDKNTNNYGKMYTGMKWFERQSNKTNEGWYSFTSKQQKGLKPLHFNDKNHNISIFISSDDEYSGISDFDNPVYKNQTDGLKQILETKFDSDIHIYVKVHPNLVGIDNSQTQFLNQIDYPGVTVIPATSKVDSYSLLKISDKIVTFGSTIGIEAVYHKVPSILIGRSFYEDLGCYIPKTHKEVIELMNYKNLLQTYNETKVFMYGYWQQTFGTSFRYYIPYSIRGGSFKCVNLGNPLFDNLKDRFIRSKISHPIINLIRKNRTNKWRQK